MAASVKPNKCLKCPYRTASKCVLALHMMTHREAPFRCSNFVKPFRCFKCAKFKSYKLVDLKRHLKSGHSLLEFEEKRYDCGNCPFRTHSKFLYLRHKMFHLCKVKLEGQTPELPDEGDEPRLHKCSHCPYTSNNVAEFKNHLLFEHTDHWFECQHCSYKGETKSQLSQHVDFEHKYPPCPLTTTFKLTVKGDDSRKRIESDEIASFECQLCPYKCNVECDLKKHMEDNHDDVEDDINQFTCSFCEFETNIKDAMRSHVSEKHTDTETMFWFKCAYKGQSRDHLQNPASYMHVHGETTNYQCSYCDFEAASVPWLRHHFLRKHYNPVKITWFNCAHCSYKGRNRRLLKQHMERKHSDKGKNFETKSIDEMKTHPLTQHANQNMKWFKCAPSPFTTETRSQLKPQVDGQHRERPRLKCDSCQFATKCRLDLRTHILSAHNSNFRDTEPKSTFDRASKHNLKSQLLMKHKGAETRTTTNGFVVRIVRKQLKLAPVEKIPDPLPPTT